MSSTPLGHSIRAAAVLAMLASPHALAQAPSFADAQKANADALRQYTYKQRTEIKLKGESKSTKLEQVRYDSTGKPQTTPINGAPAPAPAKAPEPARGGRGGGRVKEKVIENKKEDFADLMKGLAQLVGSYAQLPPDKAKAFAAAATKTPGEGAMQGTARIQGANVLAQGDSMTMWIDPASQLMRRVEIKSMYEKHPATLAVDYKGIANGPTALSVAKLQYPEKNVELSVDRYDYVKLAQ